MDDQQKPFENNTPDKGEEHLPNSAEITDLGDLFGGIDVDRRTRPFRRWRTLYQTFRKTAGVGVIRSISFENACKRSASLTILLERMDADLLNGKPVNPEAVARISNTLGRYLYCLGLLPQWEENKNTKVDPHEALERLKNWNKEKL